MTNRNITRLILIAVVLAFTIPLFNCNMETLGVDLLEEKKTVDGDEDLEAVDLEGTEGSKTWAMRELMHAGIDLLEEGTITSYLDLTSYWVVTFDDDNNMSRQLCHFQFGPVMGTQVIVDDAVASKLTADDMQWTVDGASYIAADYAWIWGANISNPLTDALPDSPDDSRLFDQDEDGNPAVTVSVVADQTGDLMGRRYMVRRSIVNSYSGEKSEDGEWIEGTFNFSLDDYVVGLEEDSNPLIGSVPLTMQDPDTDSPFVLRRLPEGSTCELVHSNGDNLFVKGSEIVDGDEDATDTAEEDSDVIDTPAEEEPAVEADPEPDPEPETEPEPEAVEEDIIETVEEDVAVESEPEADLPAETEATEDSTGEETE